MSNVVKLVDDLTHDGHEFNKDIGVSTKSSSVHRPRGFWMLGIFVIFAVVTIAIYFLVRSHDTKHPYHPHIQKHGITKEHNDIPSTTEIGKVYVTDVHNWEPNQFSFGDKLTITYRTVSGHSLIGKRTFQLIVNDEIVSHVTTTDSEVTITIPPQSNSKYYTPDANCFAEVITYSGDKGHFKTQSKKFTIGYGLQWVPGGFGSATEKTHTVTVGTKIQFQLQWQYSHQGDVFSTGKGKWTLSKSVDKKTWTSVKIDQELINISTRSISIYHTPTTEGTFYYHIMYERYSVVNNVISESTLTIEPNNVENTLLVTDTSFHKQSHYNPGQTVNIILVGNTTNNIIWKFRVDSTGGSYTQTPVQSAKQLNFNGKRYVYIPYMFPTEHAYLPRFIFQAINSDNTILASSGDIIVKCDFVITNVPKKITIFQEGSHTETNYNIVLQGLPDFETYKTTWTSPLTFKVEVTLDNVTHTVSSSTLQSLKYLIVNLNNIKDVYPAGTTIKNAKMTITLLTNIGITPAPKAVHTIDELEWVSGTESWVGALIHNGSTGPQEVMLTSDGTYSDNIIISKGVPSGYTFVTRDIRITSSSAGVDQIAFVSCDDYYYWSGASGTPKLVKAGSNWAGVGENNWTPIPVANTTNSYRLRYGGTSYLGYTLLQPWIHGTDIKQYKGVFTTVEADATIFISSSKIPTE